MSVTMSKADGVTMLTMTSDADSLCPPLCQILCGFCYSPVCCSVSRHMKKIQSGSLSVLGTLQIVTGMFHIGLAAILCCSWIGSWYQMDESGFPFWMGALFMIFGVVCILTEKFPSPCLIFFHLTLHLCGVALAIAAIVLYSANLARIRAWWMCEDDRDWYRHTTPSPNPEVETLLKEKCLEARSLLLALLRSINAVLIVLSVVELCGVISAFVLGIKTLRSREKKPKQAAEDPEQYTPLLQDAAAAATMPPEA